MFKFLNPKSIAKAAKDLGIAAGVIGGTAALTYLQDPEAAAALIAAFGPVSPLVAPLYFAGIKYLLDRVKHGPAE